jgi:hypothetical protein
MATADQKGQKQVEKMDAPRQEKYRNLRPRFGRPKDQDQAPDKPPILFMSAYGPPGSHDPLARKAAEDTQPSRRARSLGAGMPPDLPHGATGANGDGDPGPGDDDEEKLVVVRG